MDILKNKPLIIVIIVGAILLGGAAYFLMNKGGSSNVQVPAEEQLNVKQVSAEEIGLSLTLAPDKQNVIMSITNLEGITSFEYEFSYDAEETVEGETITAPKGVLSTIEVNGESEIEREIYLGTCSGTKCRPDIVRGDINVVLKINYQNGEIGATKSTIPFESEE